MKPAEGSADTLVREVLRCGSRETGGQGCPRFLTNWACELYDLGLGAFLPALYPWPPKGLATSGECSFCRIASICFWRASGAGQTALVCSRYLSGTARFPFCSYR